MKSHKFSQTRVELTVEIYQAELFGSQLKSKFTTNPNLISSSGLMVANKNTKWYCDSRKKSRFFGIAYATAFIGGQKQVAPRARSEKTIRLPCGD